MRSYPAESCFELTSRKLNRRSYRGLGGKKIPRRITSLVAFLMKAALVQEESRMEHVTFADALTGDLFRPCSNPVAFTNTSVSDISDIWHSLLKTS